MILPAPHRNLARVPVTSAAAKSRGGVGGNHFPHILLNRKEI